MFRVCLPDCLIFWELMLEKYFLFFNLNFLDHYSFVYHRFSIWFTPPQLHYCPHPSAVAHKSQVCALDYLSLSKYISISISIYLAVFVMCSEL